MHKATNDMFPIIHFMNKDTHNKIH